MQSKGVSILIPTRGRLKRFKVCLEAIERLKTGTVEVLTYIDDDDPTDYPIKTIIGPRVGSSERLKKLAEKAQYDHFLLIGDDQIPQTKGWDKEMVSLMPADKIGLVHCKDNWKETVSAILIHRRWYEIVGICPEGFQHFGPDTYMADVARSINRLFRTEKAVIEHHHYRNGKADKDETYDYPRQSLMNQKDENRLKILRSNRMGEDIQKLKGEIDRLSQGS